MKKVGNIVRIALVIVVIALIFMNLKNGFEININYSEMISAIKQEKVKKMKISADKTYVKYVYNDKNAKTNIPNDQVFLTEVSEKIKDGFVIEQEELTFVDKVVQNTVVILPTAIVIILVISWINMASIRARQEMPDKDMAIGKSKARLIEEDENTVRFDNVAGIEEEKGELKEIVDFLKNPQKYIEMGARIPKGVLLVGRPGTRQNTSCKSSCRRSRSSIFHNFWFRLCWNVFRSWSKKS